MTAVRRRGRLTRHVEHQFYRTLVARNHHYSLAVVVASSALFVGFGILEASFPLAHPEAAALLRYGAFPPFAIVAFLLVRRPGRRPIVVFGAHAALILVAAGISLAIMVREEWPVSAVYYIGLAMAVIYSLTMQIVGFKVAFAVGGLIAVATLAAAGASPSIPGEWTGVASFFMVACIVAGGASAFRRERAEREAFLRGHELQIERNSLEARVRERSRDLQVRLDERDSLLHEIHHRVYNNQQLILSFIELQRSRYGESDAARELRRAASRIRAMSLVQKRLYDQHSVPHLELNELTAHVASILQGEAPGVRFDLTASGAHIPIDSDERAVTIALAIDELLWIGCEHDVGACPRVSVNSEVRTATVTVVAELADGSRPGCPEELGILIAQSLARQLSGACSCTVTNGDEAAMTLHLTFPTDPQPRTG